MKCPKCNTNNPDNSTFCGSCGASLVDSNVTCPKCNNMVANEAKFCEICSSPIESFSLGLIRAADVSTDIETQSLPMVNFAEAIKRGFNKYLVFRSRATRAEFWWWAVFWITGLIITGIIDQISGLPSILNVIFWAATLMPSISVGSRRLHDINKTGWWQLLWLIPIVTTVIIILIGLRADRSDLDGWSFYDTAIGIVTVLTLIVIVLLIYFLIQQGDKGPNKYGKDPVNH